MTTFLPDASTLIEALRNRCQRRKQLAMLVSQGHSLACCTVTVGEIYGGLRDHEVRSTEEFMSEMLWLDTPFAVARRVGLLRNKWARVGATLTPADTLIAATAIDYDVTFITANRGCGC